MTRQEAMRLLEKVVDVRAGTLTGEERLADLEGWDSLSTLVFIAEADKQLGLALPGSKVAACKSVAELLRLLGVSTDLAA